MDFPSDLFLKSPDTTIQKLPKKLPNRMRSMVSNIKPKVDIKHNVPQITTDHPQQTSTNTKRCIRQSDVVSQLRFCSDPFKGGELSEPKVGSVDAMILKFQKCPQKENVATRRQKVT